MAFQEGDFVRHQKAPKWGKGKILRKAGEKYRIFFENAGGKLLSSVAPLEEIEIENNHPILGHITADTNFEKFRTPEELERNFLELFSEGFEDPEYLEGERQYKVEASDFAKDALSAI